MVGVAGEEIAYSTVYYRTNQTNNGSSASFASLLPPAKQPHQTTRPRKQEVGWLVGRLFGRVGLIVVAKLTPPEHIYLPLSCYSHGLSFDPVHPFLYFSQPQPFLHIPFQV